MITGKILEQIFTDGLVDTAAIRDAGKLTWNLKNTSEFIEKLVDKDHKAFKAVKEAEAIDQMALKAAGEELFPDEQMDEFFK